MDARARPPDEQRHNKRRSENYEYANMNLTKRVKLFKYLVYFYVFVLFVSIISVKNRISISREKKVGACWVSGDLRKIILVFFLLSLLDCATFLRATLSQRQKPHCANTQRQMCIEFIALFSLFARSRRQRQRDLDAYVCSTDARTMFLFNDRYI